MLSVDQTIFLTGWHLRPSVILLLILLIGLYQRGLSARGNLVPGRQKRAFRFSLFIFGLSLLSPIDTLANNLFFMRVTQHILLISVFPSAFMSSDPFELLYAGLPDAWKTTADRICEPLYRFLKRWMTKGTCWFIFVAAVWMWYDNSMVNWTLTFPWIRNIELLMMTVGAGFHWWHVKAAAPRIHPRLPTFPHMIYTLAGAGPLKIPGLFILFSITSFYAFPTTRFFGWEIEPLLSQHIGGGVVWTLAGTVYTIAFIRFFSDWMRIEEEKPPLPLRDWDTKKKLMAPHLE